MTRKVLTSFFLLFAFSLIQAHNFIPHIHLDDVFETSHQHSHGHDHEHDAQEPTQSDDDKEPFAFFSHLQHLMTTEDLTFELAVNFRFERALALQHLISKIDLVLLPSTIPIKPRTSNYVQIRPYNQTHQESHSLRGPPAYSV